MYSTIHNLSTKFFILMCVALVVLHNIMPCLDGDSVMLKSYFRFGFSYKEIISLLSHKHSVITQCNGGCVQNCIWTEGKSTNWEELAGLV